MDVEPPSHAPVARTSSGLLSGSTVPADASTQRPIHVFRGIEYAQSPVGHLRFAPPRPALPWEGTREATAFGPLAPQIPGVLETMSGAVAPVIREEGCLTLNVWTPGCDGRQRPVMVWIHGGAFLTGSGSLPWYDGTRLAAHGDVVVVTINYRLGAFGYLQLDDVPGSGCAGLFDQIEALRWVQAHIEAFGGDPAQVTVFGESAGAMSIGALLGTPSARGLFRQAVLQSGACAHVSDLDSARRVRERFLELLELPDATAEQLRAVPHTALLEAQKALLAEDASGALPFQPVVGDGPLVQHPLLVIERGEGARPSAVLHGTTLDEMRLFTAWDQSLSGLTRDGLVRKARARHGDRADQVVSTYEALHPDLSPPDLWSAMQTDDVFRAPAQAFAAALATAGIPSWQYLFAWRTPLMGGRLGACHAIEIPFVFDNLHQAGAGQFLGGTAELGTLTDEVHRAWLSFARGGAPRADWAAEASAGSTVWRFGTDAHRGPVSNPFAVETAVWDLR